MYSSHFNTNVKGAIFLTKAALDFLPQGGRIVFVSSAAARLGVPGQTIYSATKAAGEALARVWAKELGQSHGITVNCVNPGPVATGECVHQPLSWGTHPVLYMLTCSQSQTNGLPVMTSSEKTWSH